MPPNIWGASQYLLGDYASLRDAFANAPESGAPVSAPSLVMLTVAHDYLGDDEVARGYVDELKRSWPDFRSSSSSVDSFPTVRIARRTSSAGSGSTAIRRSNES